MIPDKWYKDPWTWAAIVATIIGYAAAFLLIYLRLNT